MFVVCAITNLAALAAEKSARVTLPEDVTVNGTLVKKGDYQVAYDEQSRALTISKAGAEVARSTARIESRKRKAKNTEITTATKNNPPALQSIVFAGDNQVIILDGGRGQNASGQQ
ncbi:MAG TPA: hypothetical protein VNO70_24040 [Blastocatellia bacterium]|nr:hypothetical protein [Blastocatellia bacterium]